MAGSLNLLYIPNLILKSYVFTHFFIRVILFMTGKMVLVLARAMERTKNLTIIF